MPVVVAIRVWRMHCSLQAGRRTSRSSRHGDRSVPVPNMERHEANVQHLRVCSEIQLFRPLPRCRGCAAALVGVIEPHLTPHCGGVADIRRILMPGQCLKPATTVLPACARDTLKWERAKLSIDVRCGSDGSCTTLLERGCLVIR